MWKDSRLYWCWDPPFKPLSHEEMKKKAMRNLPRKRRPGFKTLLNLDTETLRCTPGK